MTKKELIEKISKETGCSTLVTKKILESAARNIMNTVTNQEPIYLRGFGTFQTKTRKEKTARDILKKKTVIIPEHNIAFFKPGKDFKASVK